MTNPCAELRQDMVAFVSGELEPLVKARLEAHLAHCPACRELEVELGRGLEAAQHYEPTLDAEHRRRLEARLSPYIEAQTGRRAQLLAWSGIGLVAVSLLLVAGVLTWGLRFRTGTPTPVAEPSPLMAVVPLPVAPAAPAVERSEPTPFVRLVTGGGWDGKLQVEDRKLTLTASRGFVAASFNGGHARSLRVVTPAAVVEVVGTRFLVEVTSDATTVAVADGRVRVKAGKVVRSVAAGDLVTLAASGEGLAAAEPTGRPFLEDPYLLTHHAAGTPAAVVKKPGKEAAPKEMWPVLDQIEQAEALVNKGQLEAALTIYQSCVADAAEAYAPYRQLCRLEMARLLGFRLGKTERARDILQRLVREERGEVGRQAALANCERDLKANPCRAIACLADVVEATGSEPELKREAERLAARWSEGAPGCKLGDKH